MPAQQKYLVWLVSFLIFFFPVVAITVKHGHGVIYILLALLGLVFATFQKRGGSLGRDEKLLFFSVVFFFAVALIAVLMGDDPAQGGGKLSKFFRFLLIIPVYFLLRRVNFSESVFWYGLVCGAVFTGLWAIYESVNGAIYWETVGRARGATHPILFGNLSLTMGVMAFAGIAFFRKKDSWFVLLPLLALVMGIAASFLSGSRGGWVALPALMILSLWFARSVLPKKLMLGVTAIFIITAVVAYFVPATKVAQRIDFTIENIQAYSDSSLDSPIRATSIGARFEMWQAAWAIFQKNPVLGVGWGNFQSHTLALVERGERHKRAAEFGHPHNEYLSVLASSGVVGFLALFLLLFIPLRHFYMATKCDSDALRSLGIAGVMLVVAYAHFALSEAIFERSLPVTFYSFFVAVLTALIMRQYELQYEQSPSRKKTLSVVMIAMNEADRIEQGLKSVAGWADEIIVLDSGSSDSTVEIARKYTDKVYETDWPGYGPQKQRALEKASCEWVLSIDADEEVSPDLRCDIHRALSYNPEADAYLTPWAVIVFGKRLDFGRSARAPMRLFKREGARFSDAMVHEHIILPKDKRKVKSLRGRLIHYTTRDFGHYLYKSAHYAWLGGQKRFDAKKKGGGLVVASLRAIWNFILIYFIRFGFLDGKVGFLVASIYAQGAFNKYAALWTLQRAEK
jgi:(heptosyl)LPS beta-1,4-glucosyltransferase